MTPPPGRKDDSNASTAAPVPGRALERNARVTFGRILAALSISAVLLWLTLRSVPIEDVGRALRGASLQGVGAALAFYWMEILVRVERWRTLLRGLAPPSFRQVMGALLVGYAANNVLPAKLGELFRADFIGRRYRVSRLAAMGTIFVERLLDMIVVLSCAATGVALAASEQDAFGGVDVRSNVVHGIIAIAVIVGLSIATLYLVTTRAQGWVTRSPFHRLRRATTAIVAGVQATRQPRQLVVLAALSLAAWLLNGLAMYALLVAVGVLPGPITIVLLLGIAGVAAAIPAAPASLGTLQFAFVLALTPSGHATSSALAAAFLVQLVLLGSVTLVGAVTYFAVHLRPAPR